MGLQLRLDQHIGVRMPGMNVHLPQRAQLWDDVDGHWVRVVTESGPDRYASIMDEPEAVMTALAAHDEFGAVASAVLLHRDASCPGGERFAVIPYGGNTALMTELSRDEVAAIWPHVAAAL
ncbi:hypothetical protein LO763_19840 [Glycomyces sp. A-F 0318]|uniref:hypothetical protein n=1 Tax=Glycomyces amatae TaxID=2881355 RepID=UPI001E53BB2F|nr:hypothetical protein [Glycomyces amatae]MCD0445865.1 hypothetical protein [Glycomyces amatae]